MKTAEVDTRQIDRMILPFNYIYASILAFNCKGEFKNQLYNTPFSLQGLVHEIVFKFLTKLNSSRSKKVLYWFLDF
jgi:hypothetical protein